MNLEEQNINSADRNLCNLWFTSFSTTSLYGTHFSKMFDPSGTGSYRPLSCLRQLLLPGMRHRARRKIPVLELPSQRVRPDRIRAPGSRVVDVRHRHDHWPGNGLVLLLPDRTTPPPNSTQSPSIAHAPFTVHRSPGAGPNLVAAPEVSYEKQANCTDTMQRQHAPNTERQTPANGERRTVNGERQ
jgi:hypothetical protein